MPQRFLAACAVVLSVLIAAPSNSAVPRIESAVRPLIAGHRGASGLFPEHTLAAYQAALADGAEMVETDLVMTRDGVLICRHEDRLELTTDVADHPEFADRLTTKLVGSSEVTGWFAEDFTWAEIQTLRAIERNPDLRPQSASYDTDFKVASFAQLLSLVHQLSVQRKIWVLPEIKLPTYLHSVGLNPESALADELRAAGLVNASSPVIVQNYYPSSLRALRALLPVRIAPILTRSAQTTRRSLRRAGRTYDAVFLKASLVIPTDSLGNVMAPTPAVRRAHRFGLDVFVWTLSRENAHLPVQFRVGADPAAAGDLTGYSTLFMVAGVDGILTDNPEVVVPARDAHLDN